MTFKKLLFDIADGFLLLDKGSSGWIQVPSIRRSWYAFCVMAVVAILAVLLYLSPLSLLIEDSEALTLVYRAVLLLIYTIWASSIVALSINYFKHIIVTNNTVHLENVGLFYVVGVCLWGLIYFQIYTLIPNSFVYTEAPLHYSPVMVRSSGAVVARFHFLLFSALQTLNVDFHRIRINSILPSILMWVQAAYNFGLIALLIASYINQRAYPKAGSAGAGTAEQTDSLDGEKLTKRASPRE
jgi:hypothetical protein